MAKKEMYFDAKDWEEETNIMEAQFIEARRKATSWEREAAKLKRELSKERKENMALMKSEQRLNIRFLRLDERYAVQSKRSVELERIPVKQQREVERLKECVFQEKRERVRLQQEVES